MTKWLRVGVLLLLLHSLAANARATPAEAPRPSAMTAVRERGELRWGGDSQGGAPYVFQDPMDPNHLVGF